MTTPRNARPNPSAEPGPIADEVTSSVLAANLETALLLRQRYRFSTRYSANSTKQAGFAQRSEVLNTQPNLSALSACDTFFVFDRLPGLDEDHLNDAASQLESLLNARRPSCATQRIRLNRDQPRS